MNLEIRLSGEITSVLLAAKLPEVYEDYVNEITRVAERIAYMNSTGANKYNPYAMKQTRGSTVSNASGSRPPLSGKDINSATSPPSQPPRNLVVPDPMDWAPNHPVAVNNVALNARGGQRPRNPHRHRLELPAASRTPSIKELQARRSANCCLTCGRDGHFSRDCVYKSHGIRLSNASLEPMEEPLPPFHHCSDSEN